MTRRRRLLCPNRTGRRSVLSRSRTDAAEDAARVASCRARADGHALAREAVAPRMARGGRGGAPSRHGAARLRSGRRPPLAAWPAADLHTLVPASIRDTTPAEPASADQAACGDGAVGPVRRYLLRELPPGRYRVSVTGAFDIVVDARHLPCDGDELGCEAASAGSAATFALTLARPETIIVEVAGLAGEGGDFSLDITPEPLCGDAICQDETCLSCAADCGVCPVQRCGDGTCQVTETCESCGRTAATVAPGAGTVSAG